MKFSLCIPTMDRYDSFLSIFLKEYIKNELIDEIIITDENGNDAKKISNAYPNESKLKIFTNVSCLGPFLNKLNCCRKANNEWVALIDSDNFADKDYFQKMAKWIEETTPSPYSILSPDHTTNNTFCLTDLSKKYTFLDKSNHNDIKKYNESRTNKSEQHNLSILFNLGNFVLNKQIIQDLNINENQLKLIKNRSSFDVVLFHYLCFTQFNIKLYLVKNCGYIHNVHNDSIYLKTNQSQLQFANYTYKLLYNYFQS